MKISLYTFSWNESKIIDYFFRHYGKIVNKFYFFDNGSTDNTIEILNQYKKIYDIEIIQKTTKEFIKFFNSKLKPDLFTFGNLVRNLGWKYFKEGDEDWIFNCDMDEFIWHKNLIQHLENLKKEKFTIIKTTAYQMVTDPFPVSNEQLYEICTFGSLLPTYNKSLIFNPNAIQDINSHGSGNHTISPTGDIKYSNSVFNLHFKFLGLQYLIDRCRELAEAGISTMGLKSRWIKRYGLSEEKLRKEFASTFKNSCQLDFLNKSESNEEAYKKWTT